MNQAYTPQEIGADWSVAVKAEANSFMPQYVPASISPFEGAFLATYEEQMTQFAEDTEKQLSRLRQSYVFESPEDVQEFLLNHRSLSEIFIEAICQLRRCFGEDVNLQLQVLRDEGSATNICGVVIWKGSLDSARAALCAFDDSWWIESSGKASGRIVFDYQLV